MKSSDEISDEILKHLRKRKSLGKSDKQTILIK